uniref:Uncharacterized protein n=1 Tax=Daphnia magna TaxID=35525 RepID=A0A0P5DHK2_9CRUS
MVSRSRRINLVVQLNLSTLCRSSYLLYTRRFHKLSVSSTIYSHDSSARKTAHYFFVRRPVCQLFPSTRSQSVRLTIHGLPPLDHSHFSLVDLFANPRFIISDCQNP